MKLTHQEFSRKVFPRREFSWRHLYGVITGRNRPGLKMQRLLDAYIASHEIAGTDIPPSPDHRTEPGDAG